MVSDLGSKVYYTRSPVSDEQWTGFEDYDDDDERDGIVMKVENA